MDNYEQVDAVYKTARALVTAKTFNSSNEHLEFALQHTIAMYQFSLMAHAAKAES